MKPAGVVVAVALLGGAALAGCLGPSSPEDVPSVAWPRCEHPFPCADGSEWPSGLDGPFWLLEVERVQVTSHDEAILDGWVLHPEVPEGVATPVVVVSSPYVGFLPPELPDSPGFLADSWVLGPIRTLVEAGYAIAIFSVRGTGASGGCFDEGSAAQQGDGLVVVEWAAAQPWSNGRVALMGLSSLSYAAMMGAVAAPPALKALVVGGVFKEFYVPTWTPQGAEYPPARSIGPVPVAAWPAYVTAAAAPENPGYAAQGHAARLAQRACPGFAGWPAILVADSAGESRNAAYWEERRLTPRLRDVRAAVLMAHGFPDDFPAFSTDTLWEEMPRAPRRLITGPWGHTFDFDDHLDGYPGEATFAAAARGWLDFWLKGLGDAPPRVGIVDYLDNAGAWRTSAAWPPVEARAEVLYFREGALAPTADAGDPATFRAVPTPGHERLCPQAAGHALVFVSDPVPQPTLVAGNPFARLRLESDLPGGVVSVHLYDLDPAFRCEQGTPVGFVPLRMGAADLRFHEGGYAARPFVTGAPGAVRVDVARVAHMLAEGHRLAVVVSGGEAQGHPYLPEIVIRADGGAEASHLVVPVVDGTFGGASPALTYPPRPFTLEAPR